MAGRNGARPMPPATITRSRPFASASGQVVPYGPRTPITESAVDPMSAWETGPTSRIVCTRTPLSSGAALVEIGTSPTPKE